MSALGLGVSGILRPREFKGLSETWGMGTALAKVRSPKSHWFALLLVGDLGPH